MLQSCYHLPPALQLCFDVYCEEAAQSAQLWVATPRDSTERLEHQHFLVVSRKMPPAFENISHIFPKIKYHWYVPVVFFNALFSLPAISLDLVINALKFFVIQKLWHYAASFCCSLFAFLILIQSLNIFFSASRKCTSSLPKADGNESPPSITDSSSEIL